MKLSKSQIDTFNADGFLTVENAFSVQEVEKLRTELSEDMTETGPFVIREGKNEIVRGVYGSHMRKKAYADLVTDPRTLGYVQQLTGYDLYLYQLKVNTKLPFVGEDWAWHYDYSVWGAVDGLPRPNLVSIGLFLDDVTEFNGPMVFVPGSHKKYADVKLDRDERGSGHVEPDDFAPTEEEMQNMVNETGLVAPKGKAGSLLFFNASVVHGSSSNISPFSRRLAIITYNDVCNPPQGVEKRADYIVCPPTAPLTVAPIDNALVQASV